MRLSVAERSNNRFRKDSFLNRCGVDFGCVSLKIKLPFLERGGLVLNCGVN